MDEEEETLEQMDPVVIPIQKSQLIRDMLLNGDQDDPEAHHILTCSLEITDKVDPLDGKLGTDICCNWADQLAFS